MNLPFHSQTTALIANGTINNYALIASLLKNYDKKIAVDGGLAHCQAMGIIPDFIIGDFDSISSKILDLYPRVPKKSFPADKDYTDLELAIAAANTEEVKKIGIFGAMERRTDHALINLYLMSRLPEKITIETDTETLVSVYGTKHFSCQPNQVISLIPFEMPATGVTTKGLKWELNNATLNKNFFSISNVCLDTQVEISISQGSLICCFLR
jgi:thiamine pyrophosphokinase